MAKKIARQMTPASTVQSDNMQRLNQYRAKASPRDFEDGLRKVTGGLRGIPTNAIQQNRWDK